MKTSRSPLTAVLIHLSIDAPGIRTLVAVTERGLALVAMEVAGLEAAATELANRFPGAPIHLFSENTAPAEWPATLRIAVDQVQRAVTGGPHPSVQAALTEHLPLDLHGTPFQQRVWAALRAIPYGQRRTYGQLAKALGLPPGAARSVGAACGANPVAIIVPCHRVVGASGKLTGFRWGLAAKARLLAAESAASPARPPVPAELYQPMIFACP